MVDKSEPNSPIQSQTRQVKAMEVVVVMRIIMVVIVVVEEVIVISKMVTSNKTNTNRAIRISISRIIITSISSSIKTLITTHTTNQLHLQYKHKILT